MNFDDKRVIFIDFETYYSSKDKFGLKELSVTEYVRDERFKVHGFAWQCADFLNKDTIWVPGDKAALVLADIDWSNAVVVSHNVKFDGAILAWRYGVKPFAWFDTVALAKAVLGENVSGYTLKGLAEYLGLKAKGELKWDGVRDLTPEQEAEMAAYCIDDTIICKGIYEKLMPQFPQGQLAPLDWTIRCFVEPKLVLNASVLGEGVKLEGQRREAAIAASGISKEVLSSNKQFAELLKQRGVAVATKISGRTGEAIPAFAKTDAFIESLRDTDPILYEARIASKANLLETRGKALLDVARTGSFPFDVGFSGAVQTHRYSGGSGAGGNPQNFTRNSFLRSAVCAPDGYGLVVGDFAAIELRVLAWLAKEPKLINAIVNDLDLYCDFASLQYGRKITKADKIERQFGKCAILGLGYNMGAKKFQATVKATLKMNITDDEAWRIVCLYRDTYFNVVKLWEFCDRMLPLIASGGVKCLFFAPFLKVQKNAIVLPSGLRLQYPNLRWTGDGYVYDVFKKKYESEPVHLYGGKLTENICQALAGEICKGAIDNAEAIGLHPVGQIHDEVICVDRDPDFAKAQLKKCMEKPPTWWSEIRLKSEVGYGPNWNEAKH